VFALDRAEVPDAPPGPDAPVPTCGSRNTVIDDEFTAAVVCDPWGFGYENGESSIEQSEGELQVRPRETDSAGCTSKVLHAVPRGGLIVEVVTIADAPGAYTALGVGQTDSIQVIDGMLYYSTSNADVEQYAMKRYVAAEMRWWRLHAENGLVLASHSSDGVSDWKVFGQRPSVPSPEVVGILAGLSVNVPSVGVVARFGRLLLCD